MRLALALLCPALALLATGCPVGPECGPTGGSCASGNTCTNTGECWPSELVHRVTIRWTILGQPASTATCPTDPDLEITIAESGTENIRMYAPVPCPNGVFTFSALADVYDEIRLHVFETGETQTRSVPPGGGDVVFDLDSGFVVVDAAPIDLDATPGP